jgi:hypothetical protein
MTGISTHHGRVASEAHATAVILPEKNFACNHHQGASEMPA